MKIHRLTFAAYELPFKKPLHTARGVIAVRRGFVIALHTDDGVGIGEVAPLPEFGTETLDEARGELEEKQPPFCPPAEAGGDRRFPATRFGVESAMRMLEARAHRHAPPQEPVRVNALIAGATTEEIWNASQQAVRAGYRTLKIKVGTRSIRSDIEIIRVLRATFPSVALRADANGAWSFDEARQFAHGVTACDLEFVEDPLRDPDIETLTLFRQNCDVPIACDEMAQSPDEIKKIIEQRLCDALVLKPSVLGSYETLQELSSRAKAAGIAVVITSLLESSIGLSYVTQAAARYGTPEAAHGLGTAELFERDTLTRPLVPSGGKLSVPDVTMLPQLLSPEIATQLGILG